MFFFFFSRKKPVLKRLDMSTRRPLKNALLWPPTKRGGDESHPIVLHRCGVSSLRRLGGEKPEKR